MMVHEPIPWLRISKSWFGDRRHIDEIPVPSQIDPVLLVIGFSPARNSGRNPLEPSAGNEWYQARMLGKASGRTPKQPGMAYLPVRQQGTPSRLTAFETSD
jgi:hypothetical protein